MTTNDFRNVSAYAIPGLKEMYKSHESPKSVAERIIKKVCDFYNIDEFCVRSKNRKQEYVTARQFCMFFIRRNTSLTLKETADIFSGRDHTTCIHSIKFIQGQIDFKHYTPIREDYLKLVQII
jgi:chromosomal replication initiator protein